MSNVLNEVDFTSFVARKVADLGVETAVPEPLVLTVQYGQTEPVLTLKLKQAFEEYQAATEQLDVILVPLLTEIGWTLNGKRYTFSDISEHSLPLMRDVKRYPFTAEENQTADPQTSKGPVVYQELVNRPEERVVAQFVLAKNELVQPLHTGDMLRSFPDPNQFASVAVQNLRRLVLEIGLTISEFQVENFGSLPWLVSFRGGRYRQFAASMITVPEVMQTLEKTINAENGLTAILPCRDKLIVTASQEDTAICEMGLLAKYLKDESSEPVSGFVWYFQEGTLRRVQTVELSDEKFE